MFIVVLIINSVRWLVEASSPDKSNFMLWKLLRIRATELARDNDYSILRLLLYVTWLFCERQFVQTKYTLIVNQHRASMPHFMCLTLSLINADLSRSQWVFWSWCGCLEREFLLFRQLLTLFSKEIWQLESMHTGEGSEIYRDVYKRIGFG